MRAAEGDPFTRRVFVALDASPGTLAALEAAVRLADLADAELAGLYVEDPALLRFAALPMARAVDPLTGYARELHTRDMERALRVQAARLRTHVQKSAHGRGLRWSFRVARLETAGEPDLTTVEHSGTYYESPPSVRPQAPLVVVNDGSSQAARAMELAERLSVRTESELLVLVVAEDPEAARSARAAAEAWLHARGSQAIVRTVLAADASLLARVARSVRGGALILPYQLPLLADGGLEQLLSGLNLPVLLT